MPDIIPETAPAAAEPAAAPVSTPEPVAAPSAAPATSTNVTGTPQEDHRPPTFSKPSWESKGISLSDLKEANDDDEPAVDPANAETDPAAGVPATKVESPATAVTTDVALLQSALIAAAKAAGIDETDPAKIQDALTAKTVAAETARAETAANAAEQIRLDAEIAITKTVSDSINHLIDNQVLAEMTALGYAVKATDGNWWEDPDTGAAALALYQKLKSEEEGKPEWTTRFHADLRYAKDDHDKKTKESNDFVSSLDTRFPNHAKDVLDNLRKFNVSPALQEDIAKRTDQLVTSKTAMLNSAISAKDAQIAELSAQVSGHAAAIAAAKAEGQKAAMTTIEAGRALPTVNGIGNPTTQQAAKYTPQGLGISMLKDASAAWRI